jgi:hypothetical protein
MEPSTESTQKTVHEMTREEYYSAALLKFSDEPEKTRIKERKEKHEFRAFWLLWVPLGFVAAIVIALATNVGNSGFFVIWAGATLLIAAVASGVSKG